MYSKVGFAIVAIILLMARIGLSQQPEQQNEFLAQLTSQADLLLKTYGSPNTREASSNEWSDVALSFLSAAKSLTPVSARDVWRRRKPRSVLTPDEHAKLDPEEKESFQNFVCDESSYYGVYSTPLAWGRAFDRLGQHGWNSFDGKKILDFGFGNVGQLRMMASLGAETTGVEIRNSLARAMYRLKSDQGVVEKLSEEIENSGSVKLVFGKWPAEEKVVQDVGSGYDLVISKNVLKYGYIHPEREAPASQLVDLGVDDETFLARVKDVLAPGGYVLIYNIHPPRSKQNEAYKPWAYGETPWDRKLVEKVGFEVVDWHVDDSEAIHKFGTLVGWSGAFESEAEFKLNFRAMFTILKKPHQSIDGN